MLWIGLTGGIATGKSTVARIFRELGVPVVDADQVAREVVAKGGPAYPAVLQAFGSEILLPSGEIDRKKLGQKVFAKPNELRKLENLVHPLVQKHVAEFRKKYQDQGQAVAIYDVPLLFEKSLQDQFDKVIVVSSSEASQKSRMKKRDQLSDAEVESRLKSQRPLAEKIAKADFVISNEGSEDDLRKSVQDVLKLVLQAQS